MSMKEVSISNSTFVEWKGEFFTEACYAEAMQGTFERWFKTGLLSLQVGIGGSENQAADVRTAQHMAS